MWNASLVAYERGRNQQAIELSEEVLRTFRGSNISRFISMLLSLRGYLLLRCDPPRADEVRPVHRQGSARSRTVKALLDVNRNDPQKA